MAGEREKEGINKNLNETKKVKTVIQWELNELTGM